jgi:hypothetical protein
MNSLADARNATGDISLFVNSLTDVKMVLCLSISPELEKATLLMAFLQGANGKINNKG